MFVMVDGGVIVVIVDRGVCFLFIPTDVRRRFWRETWGRWEDVKAGTSRESEQKIDCQ